jgi:hypothetical protein
MALGMVACRADVRVETQASYYTVYESPPDPPQETRPAAPDANMFWTRGHWDWDGSRWSWVEGRWLPRKRGYIYVSPHWARRGRGWRFVAGEWRAVGLGRKQPALEYLAEGEADVDFMGVDAPRRTEEAGEGRRTAPDPEE